MSMNLDFAEGWRPEEGDTLVGKITDIATGSSNYGGMYPIITVENEQDGEQLAVHCFHTGLLNRVRELRPQVGERIGIQYKGKRELKSDANKTVAVYVVKIDGRSADVWGTLDAADRTAAPIPAQRAPVDDRDFTSGFTSRAAASSPSDDDDIPF